MFDGLGKPGIFFIIYVYTGRYDHYFLMGFSWKKVGLGQGCPGKRGTKGEKKPSYGFVCHGGVNWLQNIG